MMSSGSGPARFELKGTLNDKLTCVPGGITGGALVAVEGRFIGGAVTGISWLERENGKPADGAIFSQPCRAWPVKFDILCMVVVEMPWGMTGGDGWKQERRGRSERALERASSKATCGACDWPHGIMHGPAAPPLTSNTPPPKSSERLSHTSQPGPGHKQRVSQSLPIRVRVAAVSTLPVSLPCSCCVLSALVGICSALLLRPLSRKQHSPMPGELHITASYRTIIDRVDIVPGNVPGRIHKLHQRHVVSTHLGCHAHTVSPRTSFSCERPGSGRFHEL
jgi:hypothetical protein